MKIPKQNDKMKWKKIFINEWNVYQVHLTLYYNMVFYGWIPALKNYNFMYSFGIKKKTNTIVAPEKSNNMKTNFLHKNLLS